MKESGGEGRVKLTMCVCDIVPFAVVPFSMP
jgi:hypothetical protein